MTNEIRNLQAAFVLFTRLPFSSQALEHQHFKQAGAYLPIIGLFIGCLSALVYSLFGLFLSQQTAIIISLFTGLICTGAIHEDGFADCCDGFLAVIDDSNKEEESREKILSIMKDSRLGSYAVLALIFLLLFKLSLFGDIIPEKHIFALICMHSLARFTPLLLMQGLNYVNTEKNTTKMTAGVDSSGQKNLWVFALVILFLALFIPLTMLLIQLLTILIVSLICRRYFNKRLAGYNGDCLGASEQLSECLILLVFAFYF